jgi:hypothetical protein
MAQIIPRFLAPTVNENNHYTRFFHTKSYFSQRSREVPYSIALHEDRVIRVMASCGYLFRRPEKFSAHRRQWDRLDRPIPRAYLRAIGVSVEIMQFTAELDAEEYEEELERPLYPRYATIRVMPGIFSLLELPDGINEAEAVYLMIDFARHRGRRCCIGFRDIKTIWIEPNGETSYVFYHPVLRLTRSHVIPENASVGSDHRASPFYPHVSNQRIDDDSV